MAKKENVDISEKEIALEEKKEVKITLKERLLNFRFLSILIACAGILSAITSIVFLVFFQLSRLYMGGDGVEPASEDTQIVGFIMFIIAIAALVMGIINAYTSYPFIINKDKLSPKKSHGWMSLAGGILDFAIVIFAVLNIILRPSTSIGFWIVTIILGVISACFSAILLLPTRNVKVYQPKPVVKE